MKKTLLFTVMLIAAFSFVRAQDIFDSNEPVTWLGVDFSALKLVRSDETVSEEELQFKYFPGWNELILKEPKKYDIAKAVGRSQVENDIEAVTQINKQAGGKFIVDSEKDVKSLDDATIRQMVQKYNLKGKSGIGLVFIIESMDKNKKEASIWVTFINMQNKSVLLSKNLIGESGGFGFRNYWAASFYKVLKDLPSQMKKWKKD